MTQGTRGRWARVAVTGFGVLICSGLVGCMNTDKDKTKNKIGAKQPTPGLPGTPTIGAPGTASRTPAPTPYGSNGIQQTGGFGQQRVGSTGQNTLNTSVPQQNYGGTGTFNPTPTIGAPAQPGFVPNVQPAGGAAVPGGYTGYNSNALPAAPVARGNLATPPAPTLTDVGPIPPAPPSATTSASAFPVQPPMAFAPLEPQPPFPAPGTNAFGGK